MTSPTELHWKGLRKGPFKGQEGVSVIAGKRDHSRNGSLCYHCHSVLAKCKYQRYTVL